MLIEKGDPLHKNRSKHYTSGPKREKKNDWTRRCNQLYVPPGRWGRPSSAPKDTGPTQLTGGPHKPIPSPDQTLGLNSARPRLHAPPLPEDLATPKKGGDRHPRQVATLSTSELLAAAAPQPETLPSLSRLERARVLVLRGARPRASPAGTAPHPLSSPPRRRRRRQWICRASPSCCARRSATSPRSARPPRPA